MSVSVHVSTHLRAYTKGEADLEAEGGTLAELMDDLERRFPGVRFRVIDEQGGIRPHMNFFVRGELTRDLACPLGAGDEVMIMGSLSGG